MIGKKKKERKKHELRNVHVHVGKYTYLKSKYDYFLNIVCHVVLNILYQVFLTLERPWLFFQLVQKLLPLQTMCITRQKQTLT